jgi:hypothetical protein
LRQFDYLRVEKAPRLRFRMANSAAALRPSRTVAEGSGTVDGVDGNGSGARPIIAPY